ncbi:MAG: tetratricopeptide repeat protein [Saprospiraceae bacterium]
MIKYFWGITLFCLLIFTNNGISQDLTYLEEKAKNTKTWEDKIKLYLEIADSAMWIGSDIDKSKEYADKVLELCKEKDCGDFNLAAYAYLAEFGINRSDYTIVEEVIIPKLEQNNFESKFVKAHFEEIVGGYYLVTGNTTKSIHHLTIGQNILEKRYPTSKRLSNTYLYLAYSYNINSTNDSSIFYMQKSVDQCRLIKDSLSLIDGLSGLSTLYSTDGNNAKAIKSLLNAIDIMNNCPITENRKYLLYGSLVDLYIKNENYKKAEKELLRIPELHEETVSIESKIGDLWLLNMSMSKLLGRMDEPEKGLIYTDSAYLCTSVKSFYGINYGFATSEFESESWSL